MKINSLINFPQTINLELTNNCNLSCKMCLNPTDSFRKKGNMDRVLLKKILDELIENKKYLKAPISICGIGEPVLYKDLSFVIDNLYSAGIKTVITTNGLLLNRKISLLLLEKCDKIMISLDTFSRDSYYKIKGVDSFNIILENIITLFYLKKTHSYIIPMIFS